MNLVLPRITRACCGALAAFLLHSRFKDSFLLSDDFILGPHPFEHMGSLGGVLAPHSDPLTILVKEEGEGNASNSQEGWDGARPMVAEIRIHVSREKRERGTEQGSKDGVGSKH